MKDQGSNYNIIDTVNIEKCHHMGSRDINTIMSTITIFVHCSFHAHAHPKFILLYAWKMQLMIKWSIYRKYSILHMAVTCAKSVRFM